MDLDVDLGGAPELVSRLDHAQQGILDLSRDLSAQLTQATPPMVAYTSPTMRPRAWGDGDVWTLPGSAWVGTVRLPDDLDMLTAHVQELLD